jgi:hypothetical protein
MSGPTPHHLLITGPGRSGTTLLVQLFEELGFDTNLDHSNYDEIANAGLEWSFTDPNPPYVVKNPKASRRLRGWIEAGVIEPAQLDFVVVAVRDLTQAAQSRATVSTKRNRIGAVGGLDNVRWARRQDSELARQLAELMLTIADYEIPHLVIAYPRLARDSEYCFRTLAPALPSIDQSTFETAWRSIVRPELVHNYSERPPGYIQSATLLAGHLLRRKQKKERQATTNEAPDRG